MDILAIILACSLHPDDQLVRALIDVQSGGNVYFVGDLATLQTKDSLGSVEEALRVADDIRQHGGRPAVGLLGVPLDWASRYGRSPADFFDACTNIAIGTAGLSEYAAGCAGSARRFLPHRAGARRPRRAVILDFAPGRTCVLSRLAADLGLKAEPAAVLKAIAARRPMHASDPPDLAAQRSGMFADGSSDDAARMEWLDASTPLAVSVGSGPVTGPSADSVPRRMPLLSASGRPVNRADSREPAEKVPSAATATKSLSPPASARR